MSIKSLEQINQEFLDEFILPEIKAPTRGAWDWGEGLDKPGAVEKRGMAARREVAERRDAIDDIPAFMLSLLEPVDEPEIIDGIHVSPEEMAADSDPWAALAAMDGDVAAAEGEEGIDGAYALADEGYEYGEGEEAFAEGDEYGEGEEAFAEGDEYGEGEEAFAEYDEYGEGEEAFAEGDEYGEGEEAFAEGDEYGEGEEAFAEGDEYAEGDDEESLAEGEEADAEADRKAAKKNVARKVGDILFYTVVVLILLATLVFHGKTNESIQLFDYSAFTVLTGSMEREIPQGSLVITKKVDPDTIVAGDDITFVRSDNATVTHRVVNIVENYDDSGARGFETQGIANPDPDPDIVYAGNLVGVVKVTIPELGFALKYISENIGLVFVLLGGVLVTAIAISKIFAGPKKAAAKGKAGAGGSGDGEGDAGADEGEGEDEGEGGLEPGAASPEPA